MPLSELQPIPGDPLAVAAAARTFDSIAAEIASTSAKLRALATANSHWTGNAATQAKTRTITLPPKLDKAQRSYATAGGALRNYANALDDAQRRSQAAVRSADVAHADLSAARAAQQSAAADDASRASAAAAAGLPTPQPTAPRYDTEISDAEARLANAVRANDEAHDDLRRAARTAAVQLHEASRAGIKNQPWWRHVINSAARFASSSWTTSLRVAARVATAISALAGLAALAVSVVGLVFPPLEGAAAVLETISLVSGVMATCADAALAVSGNASWKSVGVDAIALTPWVGSKLVGATARLVRASKTTVYASSRVVGTVETAHSTTAFATWNDARTLARHFRDHGADFGAASPRDYAWRASRFLQDAVKSGDPVKVDADGVIRVYNRAANTFGSYNPDGSTRTFFRPTSDTYWERQPGAEPWSG